MDGEVPHLHSHSADDREYLENVGNICQGCGRPMPVPSWRVHIPQRGEFHPVCAERAVSTFHLRGD